MDLDAKLLHSSQWQWTRNLVVASHFGLQLEHDIQDPIPPFRDNSQTALFYSVLRALEYLHLHSDPDLPYFDLHTTDPEKRPTRYSTDVKPRLYEIGRYGAVDISQESTSSEFESIHASRPDLEKGQLRFPLGTETIIWGFFAIFSFGICGMLISTEIKELFGKRTFWVAAVGIPAIFVSLMVLAILIDKAEGEPFVLTEGVSVWPSVAIHLIAVSLCLYFYCYSRKTLKENDEKIDEEFFLHCREKASSSYSWLWSWIRRWHYKTDQEANRTEVEIGAAKKFHFLSAMVTFFRTGWQRCWSIADWRADGETDVSKLWKEYRIRGGLAYSLWRILPPFGFFCIFVGMLFWKLGAPSIPCRGSACFVIYQVWAYLSGIAMILLMLYVIDTTRLCRRLVMILSERNFPWRDGFRMYYEFNKRGVDKTYLKELLCINLIAKWTAVISYLLYFPLIILFLISVARYSYIDNFNLPMGLVIIYGLTAAYAVVTVVALRASAEKTKRAAIEQLQEKLSGELSSQFSYWQNRKKKRRQVEQVIKEIEENHEGAFLPFTKYPVLGAIAVPAGGTGLLYLVEYLATAF